MVGPTNNITYTIQVWWAQPAILYIIYSGPSQQYRTRRGEAVRRRGPRGEATVDEGKGGGRDGDQGETARPGRGDVGEMMGDERPRVRRGETARRRDL